MQKQTFLAVALLSFIGLQALAQAGDHAKQSSMQLASTAFSQGETVPKSYTADGKNLSPPLRWSAPPPR